MFDSRSFDFLSILSAVVSLDTLWRLKQNWSSFWDDRVSRYDHFLAQRVAVFVLVPLGVLLHEVGHALATWQVGGEVVEFQWRIFWGYIIPRGSFTDPEIWWIAFSGNLVSILLGLIAIPGVALVRKPILKELLYMFAVIELTYSLLFYPLFSWLAVRGDWLTIYDFSIRPYAQLTLIVHGLLLAGLWWLSENEQVTAQLGVQGFKPKKRAKSVTDQIADQKNAPNQAGSAEVNQAEQEQSSLLNQPDQSLEQDNPKSG